MKPNVGVWRVWNCGGEVNGGDVLHELCSFFLRFEGYTGEMDGDHVVWVFCTRTRGFESGKIHDIVPGRRPVWPEI